MVTDRIWFALGPLHICTSSMLPGFSLCPPDKLMSHRRSEVSWGRVSEETPPATQARPRSRHQARQGGNQKWHMPEKLYRRGVFGEMVKFC